MPPLVSTNGAARPTTAKQAFYQAADQLTDQGTNRDHPLLSDHGPTRNDAVRELAGHLGVKEMTVRKYAKAYQEERTPAAGNQ